jgi:hypothetical protein
VFRDRSVNIEPAGAPHTSGLLDEDSKEWQERLSRWAREALSTPATQPLNLPLKSKSQGDSQVGMRGRP